KRPSATRSHLALIAGRNLDRQAGRNRTPLVGRDENGAADVGHQVHPGGMLSLIDRKLGAWAKTLDFDDYAHALEKCSSSSDQSGMVETKRAQQRWNSTNAPAAGCAALHAEEAQKMLSEFGKDAGGELAALQVAEQGHRQLAGFEQRIGQFDD